MTEVNPAGQGADQAESAGLLQPDSRPARPESSSQGETASSLVLDSESRHWRRRLGALAWVALEELAFAAHRDHQG